MCIRDILTYWKMARSHLYQGNTNFRITVASFIEICKTKSGGEGEIRTPDTGFPV
jgi:hypothetical protein